MRVARCLAVLFAIGVSYGALEAQTPVVLNVRDFGAKGDGVTDDYEAMKAAAAALCSSPAGSRLVYPPGTYRINRYRVFRGPAPNGVDDIVYRNCNGVTISGYGAKIDVKGDFHMDADFYDEQWFSYSKQVTPFFMLDSADFTIEGFEMYGNVDKMTKDPGVIEDNCAGIVTRRCSRYLLRDMDIHHFSVDAIELGWLDFDDVFITDKDARIENVSAHHNGRTAMAMVHVRRAWVIDSSFNHAGHTGGAFGDFNPQAGIDIEPDFTTADGVDVRTGEIYFINTTWRGNKGPELLAGFPDRVETVVVHGSTIVREPGSYPGAYALAFAPKSGVLEKSTIDARDGLGVILGPWGTGALNLITGVTYANNLFRISSNAGLVSDGAAAIDFVNNDVEVTSPATDGTVMDLSGLRRISGNRFFIDGAGSLGTNGQTAIRMSGSTTVQSNEYRTNLSASGAAFATSYGNTTVSGELFPDAPRFRPAASANWSPSAPYPSAAPAASDTTPPVFSNIAARHFSSSTLISWLTDEAATSVVEYGPTVAYGSTVQLTDLTRYHPVFLTDVQLGATYHYRVRSTDAAGNTRTSSDRTFTVPSTPRPPVVTTGAASAITQTAATLNGTVNPGGSTATTGFEYGLDTTYGSTAAAQTLTGTTTQAISTNVTLTCGTVYHYRARATTSLGTRYGADQTFATGPCPCTSFTIQPASVSASAAAGSQVVGVTGAPAGCAGGNWSASGNGSWLTVSPAGGSGSGSTTVSWTANTSTSSRSGSATIAGKTFTASQAGMAACSYAIAPSTASAGGTSGTGSIDVTGSPAGCSGSWSAASGAAFLTLTGTSSGSGAGAWQVPYAYTANPSATSARQGTITFTGAFPGGGTFTLTQARNAPPSKSLSDFDGDGKSDILWYHTGFGETLLWTMDGYTPLSMDPVADTADLNWKIAGTGDFDGNGTTDVLWRHATSGENYVWLMDGPAIAAADSINFVTDLNWKIAGVADYDGDGKSDILWRHATTGNNYMYLMDGFTIAAATSVPARTDTRWKVAGSGDLDGDGKADIVWRHSGTGDVSGWIMSGYTRVRTGTINSVPDQNWTVAGVGDFDGDAKADLFWRHLGTGENYLYLMDGTSIASQGWVNDVVDLSWKIVATGDYDGDAKTDVLWRHAATGENYIYLMDGFTIVTGTDLPTVEAPQWTVVR